MSRFLVLLLFFCAQTPVASAQNRSDLEQQLKTQLEGKTVLVRGFYQSADVHYDQDGQIIGEVPSGPWTLFGYVHVNTVRLDENSITIQGQRISIKFKGASGKPQSEEVASKQAVVIGSTCQRVPNKAFPPQSPTSFWEARNSWPT
jgi:hypothetical protein